MNRPLIIDSPTTLDADDAFRVSREPHGWVAEVFITDLTTVVPEGSDADREARARGFSRYRAGHTEHMLGETLAITGSLREADSQPVIITRVLLGDDFDVQEMEISRGLLEDAARISYPETRQVLADPLHPLYRSFADAYELARGLLALRRSRGALAVYDLQRGLATNEEGHLYQLDPEDAHPGYIAVQEMAILANYAQARRIASNGRTMLFRNHRASNAAPNHLDLLVELDAALASPELSLDSLRERWQIVLSRAEYGVVARGHYGLNLPVYTHSTSPLRRYADLANQRQLVSMIERKQGSGEGPELNRVSDELATIAEELNALTVADQAAQAAHMKEKDRTLLRSALGAEGTATIDALDPDHFHRAVKLAAREGRLSATLAAALRAHFASGGEARNAYFILFDAHQIQWAEQRGVVSDWLARNPEHAVSVLTIASQRAGLGEITYEDEGFVGPDHARSFRGRATTEWRGERFFGAERRGPTKRSTRHQAALSLLCAVTGLDDTSRDLVEETREIESPIEQSDTTGLNAVAALNELAAKRRLPQPNYSFMAGGPDHAPSFHCQALLTLPSGPVSAEGEGGSKNAAKHAAATALLAQIDPVEA